MEEKLFSTHKYFIFKLADILNNSFHTFEEKRIESLQLYIELCLETYEEIHSTLIGTDKLEKSYRGLLNSLVFQLSKHPFRNLAIYRMDFERVKFLIGGKDISTNSSEIYLCLKTLQKKLQMQVLVSQYVECLKMPMIYRELDILIEAFVSDLLYVGYSLNYLNDWYVRIMRDDEFFTAIEKKNIQSYINKLSELDGKRKKYEVIIPYKVKSESQKSKANELLKNNFLLKNKSDYIEINDWKWKEDNYASKEYIATDYYKAISMAKKEFITDKELFYMWQGVSDIIRENVLIGCLDDGKLLTMDIRKVDNTKLISYFDKNRYEQLNTFIMLKDENQDVDTLERILHTLHTAKAYNIQNRFLNFWSALEYSIYPFPRNSIIEKARIVVSKSFTLFYVKNKMNIFWDRLNYTMEKKNSAVLYPICKKFVETCKDDKDFDTIKVIRFLQNTDEYTDLLKEISFHIILARELQELIMLITEPKKLKNVITDYCDSIMNDLNVIYRLRNQLIHSAKSVDDSLEHISLRLYRYVNSILSTILYYKKKKAESTIEEILNSLNNTYDVYIEQISQMEKEGISVEDGYKIVRPKYLFLE